MMAGWQELAQWAVTVVATAMATVVVETVTMPAAEVAAAGVISCRGPKAAPHRIETAEPTRGGSTLMGMCG